MANWGVGGAVAGDGPEVWELAAKGMTEARGDECQRYRRGLCNHLSKGSVARDILTAQIRIPIDTLLRYSHDFSHLQTQCTYYAWYLFTYELLGKRV